MPHFARHIVCAGIQAAIQNQSRAKSRAKGEENHVLTPLARAKPPFRQRAGIRVVLQKGGRAHAALEPFHDGHIVPAWQVGRRKNAAIAAIQRAAAAHANRHWRFLRRLGQQRFEQALPGGKIRRCHGAARKHLAILRSRHERALCAPNIQSPIQRFHTVSPMGSASMTPSHRRQFSTGYGGKPVT